METTPSSSLDRIRGQAPRVRVLCPSCGRWLKVVEDATAPGAAPWGRLRMRCRCGAAPVVTKSRLDRAVARAALEGRRTVTVGLDL